LLAGRSAHGSAAPAPFPVRSTAHRSTPHYAASPSARRPGSRRIDSDRQSPPTCQSGSQAGFAPSPRRYCRTRVPGQAAAGASGYGWRRSLYGPGAYLVQIIPSQRGFQTQRMLSAAGRECGECADEATNREAGRRSSARCGRSRARAQATGVPTRWPLAQRMPRRRSDGPKSTPPRRGAVAPACRCSTSGAAST
jgi:hypothetical protein